MRYRFLMWLANQLCWWGESLKVAAWRHYRPQQGDTVRVVDMDPLIADALDADLTPLLEMLRKLPERDNRPVEWNEE